MVTKQDFIRNASWKMVGDICLKGISLIVSIVLARLLSPEDYGIIAITAIFTNLSDLLIDGGFSTALIRKERVNDSDYGCVFLISIIVASILYFVLFLTAPSISRFYNKLILTPVLRVISLAFFLQTFTVVRVAIVNRTFQFKLMAICSAVSSILSGIAGLFAAYSGLGVWALVIQRLTQIALTNVLLFLTIKEKIKIKFDFSQIKDLLSFSIGVVGSSLLNYFSSSLYSMVIGKHYSISDLGYYDKGSQLPMQASLYTFGAMSSVLLPTISSYQTDLHKIKHIIRRVVRMTSYIIFPMMIGMSLVSKELIIFLFTEKWLPAENIMRSFCIYYLATPFMLINIQLFFALGKSFLRVKTEIMRACLMIIGILTFAYLLDFEVSRIAILSAMIAVLTAIITFCETRRLISYSWSELLVDMLKPVIITSLMCVCVLLASKVISYNIPSTNIVLIIKVGVGISAYVLLSWLFQVDEFMEIMNGIKLIVKR